MGSLEYSPSLEEQEDGYGAVIDRKWPYQAVSPAVMYQYWPPLGSEHQHSTEVDKGRYSHCPHCWMK